MIEIKVACVVATKACAHDIAPEGKLSAVPSEAGHPKWFTLDGIVACSGGTKARPRARAVMRTRQRRRWSHAVATDSTFPPAGLFTRDARTIAETMARPEVSPGGLGPAIRMVTFFINRAGRTLSEDRRAELEAAKRLLRERKAATPVLPPAQRAPGRYRHRALGPVRVEKRGRTWWMHHGPGRPPIALGPDGWRHLEPKGDGP